MDTHTVNQSAPISKPAPAITAAQGRAIWEDVQATVPLGTDRIKHGTLGFAGYWTGSFTQTQLDEFNRRTQKIIRAARKARKAAQA